MIRSILILSLAIFLVTGCQNKVKPTYTLTDEQIANLMLDLQLSEVAVSEVSGAQQDSLKEIFWHRYTEVYKHSKGELEEEIRKLETDPDKLKVVMDRVQALSDSLR